MHIHDSTFEYLKPTDEQLTKMAELRAGFADFATKLDEVLPDGADKTYLMRKLREVAMWALITITRDADGTPRND